MKQAGLRRAADIAPFDLRRVGIYAGIAVATLVLWGFAALTSRGLVIDVAAIGVTGLVLLVVSRQRLDLGRHFPEIARLPKVGRYLVEAKHRH